MRGLTQASALLLAPTLALAHGPHHGPPPPPPPPPPPMGFLPDALDVTPSAFVTLKLPWGETETYPVTLRLDVDESEDVCGPASIRLNGEKLTQDAAGHGVGSFYLNNDTIISADWDFECIGPHEFPFAQSMRFNVRALDDMALSTDASFWVAFKQTAPVRIADVGGADYVWSLSVPFSKKEAGDSEKEPSSNAPPIWEHPTYEFQDPEEELQVELMELNALHKQILELEGLVKEREASVSKKLGKKYPPPPPSTFKMIKQCDGVQCVVHTLSDKVKHTAHRIYGSLFGHHGHGHGHGPHGHGHHGNGSHPAPPHHPPPFPFPGGHPPPPPMCDCPPHHPPPPPPHHDGPPPPHRPHDDDSEHERPKHPKHHGKEHPMASEHEDQPPSGRKHGHHGHHPPPPPPPHHPIVVVLGIATIALAIFSAIGIAFIHRRVARLSPESRRAIRRALRQERRDRKGSRSDSAFKAAINAFFARWTGVDEDEEKRAMLAEGRRRRTSSGSSVTMEQEIAQFRQAAYMVEGLVNAEEGRNGPHHAHTHSHSYSYSGPHAYAAGPPIPTRPPMVPHHSAAAYAGYVDTNENLPSYDDEQHDSSVVSDGCRYTPGSSDYAPSNSASNADDVLGDSKN